jgi:hypothetical protein
MTSDEIYARLVERYSLADGWITLGEVQPRGTTRRFDAIAIMGWECRGHEVLGFEIKVSRGDWLKELADTSKSAPLVSLCSRWWICAPPNVVQVSELPEAWGLLVFHEKRVVAAKQAKRLDKAAWDQDQWRCMMLRMAQRERSAAEISRAQQRGYALGKADAEKSHQPGAVERSLRRELDGLKRIVERAEDACGMRLHEWTDFNGIGWAVRVAQVAGDPGLYADVAEGAARNMVKSALRVRNAARQSKAGILPPVEAPWRVRRKKEEA